MIIEILTGRLLVGIGRIIPDDLFFDSTVRIKIESRFQQRLGGFRNTIPKIVITASISGFQTGIQTVDRVFVDGRHVIVQRIGDIPCTAYDAIATYSISLGIGSDDRIQFFFIIFQVEGEIPPVGTCSADFCRPESIFPGRIYRSFRGAVIALFGTGDQHQKAGDKRYYIFHIGYVFNYCFCGVVAVILPNPRNKPW